MKNGRQSMKVTRTGPGVEAVKGGAESLAELENVIEATPAISGVLQREGESAFQV